MTKKEYKKYFDTVISFIDTHAKIDKNQKLLLFKNLGLIFFNVRLIIF